VKNSFAYRMFQHAKKVLRARLHNRIDISQKK
jgi:hypothetical protein